MIRVIFGFLLLMAAFHVGIQAWRGLTNKQRWSTVKTLSYSVGLAIMTAAVMVLLVFFF